MGMMCLLLFSSKLYRVTDLCRMEIDKTPEVTVEFVHLGGFPSVTEQDH
jgi:hypothetical protein